MPIFAFPDVIIRAKATSTWTWKHVEDRLAYLREQPASEDVDREIRFLQKLKLKR